MTQPQTRDFSRKRPPIFFTVDDDRFDCQRALHLDGIMKLMSLGEGMPESGEDVKMNSDIGTRVLERVTPILKLMMKKESFKRFMIRFKPVVDEDGAVVDENWEPIDHEQLLEIIQWLTEQYTGRPTEPSSNSSGGSPSDDGTSPSTAGAPQEGWILGASTPEDSLIS